VDDRPSPKERSAPKRIPSDVIVAGLALLISGLAAAAGWYQTHVIAQQLSAAVWPYVTVGSTYDGEHLRVAVRNDGLGPAIVESFVVLVDGKPQRSVLTALRSLVGRAQRGSNHDHIALAAVVPGEVIRSNGEVTLFEIASKTIVPGLGVQMARRLTLHTCYCSIVGNCWTLHLGAAVTANRPIAVDRCKDESSDQLQQPNPTETQAPGDLI
jgi:hypothetical protein